MIRRYVASELEAALARQAATALLGPRQVGKTTLATGLIADRPAIYLDLQSQADRARLNDAPAFLERYEDKLIVLDEIHRVPELFAELRGIIDLGRRRGKRYGRFLLLGSASIDLLRQSSETLAGRIAFIELAPFSAIEVAIDVASLHTLWLRGGFPESFLAPDDAVSYQIRRDFIRTYLQRDVREFAPRISTDVLERFWQMLAHLHGGPVNASRVAAGLGISATTVNHYIDLLDELFLVRKLLPFHANLGKRLVKAPKVYIRDSGLLHTLLGIREFFDLAGHPVVGASWEGLAIESILTVCGDRARASYYRTSAGAEIDLVLEFPKEGRIAIEIKSGRNFKLERGFHEAYKDVRPNKAFVVYGDTLRYPVLAGVEAIGLAELCGELQAYR